MSGLSGVILAGGASSRMGTDKALLQIGGISMIEHMRRLLLAAGANTVEVLGRLDVPNGHLDTTPLAGPAVALSDYLNKAPANSRHLVVPVDMPALKPRILQILAEQQTWAYYRNHMLPLLAVAQQTPLDRCASMRDLLCMVRAVILDMPPDNPTAFTNLNSPDDIAEWQGL